MSILYYLHFGTEDFETKLSTSSIHSKLEFCLDLVRGQFHLTSYFAKLEKYI